MTATARRPHRKSRNGCLTCKRRRVKCDESGPPCGPCILRSIECEYASTRRPQLPTPESLSPNECNTPNRLGDGDWCGSRRLLELELLHQWTTVTYKSYCGTIVGEYLNWQVVVPLLGLKHDPLLHGMLAMSALEIAVFTQDDEERAHYYLTVALEYQSTASSGLRRELQNITPANRQPLFALSSILLILGLAIPRFLLQRGEEGNMLDYMITYLALLNGLRTIADMDPDYRQTEPLMSNFRPWSSLPAEELEPDLQCALLSLLTLNDDFHGSPQNSPGREGLQAISYHAANRRAIFYLQENFSRCRDPDTRSYCLGWPHQAGEEYCAALTNREPVAVVTLMFWGVLLEQASAGLWWAEGVGTRLIQDLCGFVEMQDNKNLQMAVHWAKSKVGLDGLYFGVPSSSPALSGVFPIGDEGL